MGSCKHPRNGSKIEAKMMGSRVRNEWDETSKELAKVWPEELIGVQFVRLFEKQLKDIQEHDPLG